MLIKPDRKVFNNFEWRIIDTCDKACPYCIESKSITRGKVIEYDHKLLKDQRRIMDYLVELVEGNIEFCGGEPTQHPKAIEWFNELCSEPYKNKFIYFVTHGDISPEQILEFNPITSNHLVTVTYHPTQVNFVDWYLKLLELQDRVNLMVTVVIPKEKTHWNRLLNELLVISKHHDIQIKFELYNNVVSYEAKDYFKTIINLPNRYFANNSHPNAIIDNNGHKYLDDHKITVSLPIIDNAICNNNMFGIFGNVLQASCAQGKSLTLNDTITNQYINDFISTSILICSNKFCSQQYRFNTIRMPGSLNNPIYNEYRELLKEI